MTCCNQLANGSPLPPWAELILLGDTGHSKAQLSPQSWKTGSASQSARIMPKGICDKRTLTPGPGTYSQRAWTRCLDGLIDARSGHSSDRLCSQVQTLCQTESSLAIEWSYPPRWASALAQQRPKCDPNVWQETTLSHLTCRKMQGSVSGPALIPPRWSKASTQPAVQWHSSFSIWSHHEALTKPKWWPVFHPTQILGEA